MEINVIDQMASTQVIIVINRIITLMTNTLVGTQGYPKQNYY